MPQALTISPAHSISIYDREAAAERRERYENQARSEATRRAYNSAWQRFKRAARLVDPVSLPVPIEIIDSYLTGLADTHSRSSINLAIASIVEFHAVAGVELSLDKLWRVRRGILRDKGVKPKRQAPALKPADIAKMIAACGPDLRGIRDRAILTLGFSTGLRRSEISALQFDDVKFDASCMRVHIRRSKTDQAGAGVTLTVERTPNSQFCAPAAVEEWIAESKVDSGALFRAVNRWGHLNHSAITGESVSDLVRDRAIDAGLKLDNYSAHSLRAGLATSALELGVALHAVKKRLRHTNISTTLGYNRRGSDEDAKDFRVLYSERAPEVPMKPIKAGETVAPIDDTELKQLIREADEASKKAEAARMRVTARMQSLGEKAT
jgi:integrase